MFSARCRRVNCVWVTVNETRRSSFVFKGTPSAPASRAPSRAAWLNSRSRSRTGWSGTGTTSEGLVPRRTGTAASTSNPARNGSNRRQRAVKGQAATPAMGRLDGFHLLPAGGADEPLRRRGARRLAKLADFRINKSQTGVEPVPQRFDPGGHHDSAGGTRPVSSGQSVNPPSTANSTKNANQPSIIFPVPQNQSTAGVAATVKAA